MNIDDFMPLRAREIWWFSVLFEFRRFTEVYEKEEGYGSTATLDEFAGYFMESMPWAESKVLQWLVRHIPNKINNTILVHLWIF